MTKKASNGAGRKSEGKRKSRVHGAAPGSTVLPANPARHWTADLAIGAVVQMLQCVPGCTGCKDCRRLQRMGKTLAREAYRLGVKEAR
jgi:hypothetical protein